MYVASEFGGWQARALRWLAEHFDAASNSFSAEASSGVISQVRGYTHPKCCSACSAWPLRPHYDAHLR